MHYDEKLFKDPEQFKPERFDPQNIGTMKYNVYLPFGVGPRACIGEFLSKGNFKLQLARAELYFPRKLKCEKIMAVLSHFVWSRVQIILILFIYLQEK